MTSREEVDKHVDSIQGSPVNGVQLLQMQVLRRGWVAVGGEYSVSSCLSIPWISSTPSLVQLVHLSTRVGHTAELSTLEALCTQICERWD